MDQGGAMPAAGQEAPRPPSAATIFGLWVFGYGSLCWNPGFKYEKSVTGCVRGWTRRFWQGNITHRGTEGQPGRVATLVEDKEGEVWGRAYEVSGEAALPYLDKRECKLGGYLTQIATFYPRNTTKEADASAMPSFSTVLYIATPSNSLWLGEAPLTDIAAQIVHSSGPSGHNVEYLLRLALFMRDHMPDAADDHLFTLEHLVCARVKESRLCLQTLMGGEWPPARPDRDAEQQADEAEGAVGPEQAPRPSSFQYTARMPEKKLRCLNI